MLRKSHYKTIVISDVHLGTKHSKAKEVVRFLKSVSCENLILNGDIIDGWRLRKGGKWKKKHTRFFRVLLKKVEKKHTRVIYLRGNHDDFLDTVVPFSAGIFSIEREFIYESHNKRYYVVHGDIFDAITRQYGWIAKLGDIGYTFLLWINKMYNHRRLLKGLPYYSLSNEIKQKVKAAVSYISNFEEQLVSLAKSKGCDGIICGHIHHPDILNYNGIEYLNSGDWIESLSALAEDDEGNWKIIYYNDIPEE
jgi:UDP-2,3-diacylglucosamine pyrophosphatase LpxH